MVAGVGIAAVRALAVDVIVALLFCTFARGSEDHLIAVHALFVRVEVSVRDMIAIAAGVLEGRSFKVRPCLNPLVAAVDAVPAFVAIAILKIVVLQEGDGVLRPPSLQRFSALTTEFIVPRITAVLMAGVIHRSHGRHTIVKIDIDKGIIVGASVDITALIANAIIEIVIPDLAHKLLAQLTGQRLLAIHTAQLDDLMAAPLMAMTVNRCEFAIIGGISFLLGVRMRTGILISAIIAHAILEPVASDFTEEFRRNLFGQRHITVFAPGMRYPMPPNFMRRIINGDKFRIPPGFISDCIAVRTCIFSAAAITHAILETVAFDYARDFRGNLFGQRHITVFAPGMRYPMPPPFMRLIINWDVFHVMPVFISDCIAVRTCVLGAAIIAATILIPEVVSVLPARPLIVHILRQSQPAVRAVHNRHGIAAGLVILVVHGRVYHIPHPRVAVRMRMRAFFVKQSSRICNGDPVLRGSFGFFPSRGRFRGSIAIRLGDLSRCILFRLCIVAQLRIGRIRRRSIHVLFFRKDRLLYGCFHLLRGECAASHRHDACQQYRHQSLETIPIHLFYLLRDSS